MALFNNNQTYVKTFTNKVKKKTVSINDASYNNISSRFKKNYKIVIFKTKNLKHSCKKDNYIIKRF